MKTGYLVATITFLLVLAEAGFSLYSATKTSRLLPCVRAHTLSTVCPPLSPPTSSNYHFILRIDDIQAYSWPDVTTRLIDDALSQNIPPTLGVVPYQLEADSQLVHFLRQNHCRAEIALHGWEHTESPAEFANLTLEEAAPKIKRGKAILEKITDEIITFIPPENQYSPGTRIATALNGLPVISAEGQGHFDATIATYDYHQQKFTPVNDIVTTCQSQIAKTGLCVVLTHPQDYARPDGSLDPEKYSHYQELLDELNHLNATPTTIQALYLSDPEKL